MVQKYLCASQFTDRRPSCRAGPRQTHVALHSQTLGGNTQGIFKEPPFPCLGNQCDGMLSKKKGPRYGCFGGGGVLQPLPPCSKHFLTTLHNKVFYFFFFFADQSITSLPTHASRPPFRPLPDPCEGTDQWGRTTGWLPRNGGGGKGKMETRVRQGTRSFHGMNLFSEKLVHSAKTSELLYDKTTGRIDQQKPLFFFVLHFDRSKLNEHVKTNDYSPLLVANANHNKTQCSVAELPDPWHIFFYFSFVHVCYYFLSRYLNQDRIYACSIIIGCNPGSPSSGGPAIRPPCVLLPRR